ncbi:MAG TPA: DNA translocase FtsK 4TM domain-containing protein, partial [Steroidobacteraceae bacterium]|nr:DNA translocase FtsK 4TM domain-containing protein [Steroidobacteraceae bacterium]
MNATVESTHESIEESPPEPRRAARKRRGPSGIVVRSLREGALWVFGAMALIVLIALLSYDRNDPSFQTTGEAGPVNNLIGPFGAQFAGLLVMLFGRPAYLIPVMIALAGWVLFSKPKDNEHSSRATFWFRFAGFVVTLLTSCGLAYLHFHGTAYPNGDGGILGSLVGSSLKSVMGFLGATLLLLALWLAGVSVFSGLSWIEVMDRVGRALLKAIDWSRERFMERREIRAGRESKELRQEVLREEQQRIVKRVPPKIEQTVPKVEKSERVERERQVPMF